jgi:2-methylcitrate dehydratase PrpD
MDMAADSFLPQRLDVTRRIADFAARLRFEDLPGEIVTGVKLHVLDAVGCGIAGADSSLALAAFRFLDIEHGGGACPVLGTDRRYGPAAAAFANSVAMNALDFDDGHEVDGRGMGHPGATIVAAALGAGFVRRVHGREFLVALAAAFEANARIVEAVQPSVDRFRAVYGVCQHQAIGAAIGFGRQLGISSEGLENAMGFAGTLANLPSLRKYNWHRRPIVSLKDFNAPAAEAGVRAVQLDGCGLVGARDVLDGEGGFWRMTGSDRFDAEGCVQDLGRAWRLADDTFKAYPACRWMHTALEGFERIRDDHALLPEKVDAVIVHTSAGLARDFMDAAPATMVDAQFSLPFAIAALVHRVPTGADWYRERTLRREDLARFARRVRAEVDPTVDEMMAGEARRPAGRVTVLARGRSLASALLTHPRGTRERPLSAGEVEAKFMRNAAPALGEDGAARMAERIGRIQEVPSVGAVFRP